MRSSSWAGKQLLTSGNPDVDITIGRAERSVRLSFWSEEILEG